MLRDRALQRCNTLAVAQAAAPVEAQAQGICAVKRRSERAVNFLLPLRQARGF